EKCHPVYCRYRFHNLPVHQTHGQSHGTHIYFKDVNVILTGTISPGELCQYLQGPPLEIEVHDRDKKMEEHGARPSLFGREPEDEKLSNVGLVTSKRTVHNPFTNRDNLWNPYGVARVDLSELVHGARYLNLSVPVHGCEPPDPTGYRADGKSGKIPGVFGSVDGPQDSPFPPGHYLDAETLLKVRVDIAAPLRFTADTWDCPYGRVVYMFHYKNRKLLEKILRRVTEINARALKLDGNVGSAVQQALTRVGLREDQKDDCTLDVITGFHVMDGAMHLLVLEGLMDRGIRELWETIPNRIAGPEDGKLEILYNSQLVFRQRLYQDFDALLCHVHLQAPLSVILARSLLYVRDMVPSLCFQALS
ncbi:hypothetical protein GDO86_019631, partial [Hymenochirus boettgeri]